MITCIVIRLSFCGFLVLLASCAGSISKPSGYGEMPPGETWVAVDNVYQSPSREMVYYDPKTIRRDGDRVRNTVRLLASSEFSRHMGTGIQNAVLVEEGSGQPVELGSANHGLWEVACGGVTMTSK
jgi:hypothetical protein